MKPLVEPAAELTTEEVARYSRHLLLPDIGMEGQRRLKNARVLIMGAGGLGSPAITYLAAAGVGTMGVVDDDVVDESNLQRQVIHRTADIGRPKVDSAVDAVAALNPLVTVEPHHLRLTRDNALDIVSRYDLVLDGADNFPTRYLVSDACELLGKPEVWGSVFRFDAQVSVFWAGHGPTYRDLFPEPPPPGAVPSCAEGGVLGAMVASVGSVMATEAVKLIVGSGRPLLGRLLVLDALDSTWRELRIAPLPGREPVTELTDVEAWCAAAGGVAPVADAAVPEVTAREVADLLQGRDRGEADFVLVDVRGEAERAVVSIPGHAPVHLDAILSGDGAMQLPRDRRVIVYCKSGARSERAAKALREKGFEDVVNLRGGVLAWVDDVDPSLPRY
ncbi:MAG TPA: molybdopterin-synthase adenylyltransferase MoeB [Actinomycetales bacterium]|jgi:adenylyltransferase/sulfurtransferase|nr:molybdopterin-synthase adenylyltransferase MoeB [Actinomycetales bacterium]